MQDKTKLTPDDFITEAAPGVARHDVQAVARRKATAATAAAVDAGPGKIALAGRQHVYPKKAKGRYRNIKSAILVLTLGIYYLLPWIRWDRGPGLPSQAFLLDFEHQRLYSDRSKSGRRNFTTSPACW